MNNEEKIFDEIWNLALKEAEKACAFEPADHSCAVGGMFIPDRRKKFTRWAISTGKASADEKGAYVDRVGGGYEYATANAYAAAFCAVLERFGIECRNNVVLD